MAIAIPCHAQDAFTLLAVAIERLEMLDKEGHEQVASMLRKFATECDDKEAALLRKFANAIREGQQ